MILVRAALASGIIFPLYIYPGDNCAGWAPAISAATTHPNLPFYFIINPASGPGPNDSQPDANYQACIPRLRPAANPDAKVLGYVPTWFADATRSSEVEADIRTYAQWGSAYRPTGIFYDQASAKEGVPESIYQNLYSGYTSYAKSHIPNAFVSLNPGIRTPSAFYNFADQIVTVENYYNNFSPSLYTISPSTPAAKQAVILTDSSSSLPSSTINQIIKTDKIGALYITDDVQVNEQNPYDSFPSYWTNFVDAVQTAAS
ncbi:spherulin-4 [Rhizoctonia solani]|uniref:Spherulin-4 n=2 Tax=Rhizoctonia solani TaxID=456999 RepID=A0A8H8T3C4_9AGAM|nr:spherulin-4 [Rhizoctonia solani]QRW27734.1 spherulin-4 [Rhizoctonia solani]